MSKTIKSADGKHVGIVTLGMFIKHIDGSKHLLRVPPAIAFDVDSIKQAEKAGATGITVADRETGIKYRTSMEVLRKHGVRMDRGHNEQIFLRLKHWRKSDPLQPEFNIT